MTLEEIKKSNNFRYKVWIEQSKYDLAAAKNSLETKNYEWSCYQSIQSVEKMVKGVIVHSGFRPPKTHRLGVLLSMANRANGAFADVQLKFRKIESYTFISRYPFVIPGENKTPHELITKEDAVTCLKLAGDILDKIEDFLKTQKMGKGKDINMDEYYFSEDDVKRRIEEVKKLITSSTEMTVEKIILFGGFAREGTRPVGSTMDILVVADTKLQFIERIQHVRFITKGGEPIIEPLIYTPEEFKFLLEEEGEGFIESALDEGKTIWEQPVGSIQ